jgi:putative FmdB family regulatory protein
MPTYSYRCAECGTFDWIHPMTDRLTDCPKCGSSDFSKNFCPTGIAFKGKGFYSTDNRGK